jgi:hypothetical protein
MLKIYTKSSSSIVLDIIVHGLFNMKFTTFLTIFSQVPFHYSLALKYDASVMKRNIWTCRNPQHHDILTNEMFY